MSKQATANKIYNTWYTDKDRKEIIELIIRELGVKPAYASTLYATAKKRAAKPVATNQQWKGDKMYDKPSATSHTPVTGTKINSFNRTNLKLIRAEMQAAIDAVAKQHGLKGSLGNIRFEDHSFTTKLSVETTGAAAVKEDRKANAFKLYARSEGLDASDFGKVFEYAGKTLKIVGYNTRAKKYAINVEDMNGKAFKVSGAQIASALGH
jgi:hypothetical protein